MELCPSCQRSTGRSWWLLEGDVYCGLCGRPVRDVRIGPAGSAGPAAAQAAARPSGPPVPALTWLVGAAETSGNGPAVASLVVENSGTLPVRVSAIDAPKVPAARITFANGELLRGDAAPVTLSLSGPPEQYPRELELVVRGNFPPKTVKLATAPAPPRLLARPAEADEWSRSVAADRGGPGHVAGAMKIDRSQDSGPATPSANGSPAPGRPSANARLAWDLADKGELVLVPDGGGNAVFEVVPEGRGWVERHLPAVVPESVRWVGEVGEPVDVAPVIRSQRLAPVGHEVAGTTGHGASRHSEEPGPLRFHLKAPPGGERAGAVTFELDALGRPKVRVAVRLVPGRPQWGCRIEQVRQESLTLPSGCPSVLYVRCEPLHAGTGAAGSAGDHAAEATAAALTARIEDYRLEASATVAGGPAGHGAPVRVRVQRLGRDPARGAAPPELRFRVTVTPPRPSHFELAIRLVAVVSTGPGPSIVPGASARTAELSSPRVLRIEAVGPADPRVSGPKVGYRLVVDFGTTFTCVGRADPDAPLNQCQPLRERSGFGALPGHLRAPDDMIPTVLWLRETETAGDPECLIGQDAEEKGPPATSAATPGAAPDPATARRPHVFRLFKPDIADDTPHEVYAPGGGRRTHYARDLVFYFLRELLSEVRAQLGQAVVRDFYITCPATFTARQRHELKSVLARLRPLGISRDADLLLDEANAGAFRDLSEHLDVPDVRSRPEQVDAMIFDFGGGTIDIAALRCRRRDEAGRQVYDLAPLGITGLRDFGGKHVTDALGRHIARRLAAHLYGARPARGGIIGGSRPAEPLMRMSRPPWLPLPASIMPGFVGQPAPVQEVAEENLQFLAAVAEDVKTLFYGTWPESLKRGDKIHIPADDPDWYDHLQQELTAEVTARVREGAARFRMFDVAASGSANDPPQLRLVKPAEWRKWLADCVITRQELDDLFAPALEEAFGRARRLWNSARSASDPDSLHRPYQPPDLFLLAGGSSQLPLVWKWAERTGEQDLGFPAHRISFSQEEAKRKVALGGALYARVRKQDVSAADVKIKPEDTLQFLLIPIVYEIQGRRYHRIFPTGYRVTPQGAPQVWAHQPDDNGELDLLIYENMDYRDGPWEMPRKLQDLKMYARGKEPLAQFNLHFQSSARTEVVYRVLREGELARQLLIQYKGRDGQPRTEGEVL